MRESPRPCDPSGQVDLDAGLAERPDVGVGRIPVGDQDVDGVRAANPGEGALTGLGQGGHQDGALAAVHHLAVDAGSSAIATAR